MPNSDAKTSINPAPAGFELNKSIGIGTFVALILSLKDISELFDNHFKTYQTFLFVALFASLRLKIFLDHHEHFHRKPYGSMAVDFTFSAFTWALYAVAAASLAKGLVYSFYFLVIALLVSFFWCLYARINSFQDTEKHRQHGIWAVLNVFYILPLCFIAWDLKQTDHHVYCLAAAYGFVLVVTIFDWHQSESWKVAYLKEPPG